MERPFFSRSIKYGWCLEFSFIRYLISVKLVGEMDELWDTLSVDFELSEYDARYVLRV